MGYGRMIGRPGWSVVSSRLVVDKGRLSMGNMLVVDCGYGSSMVDLLVVMGSDRGRDNGSLVASVAMADTGERTSHPVGCVEVTLRAG